MTTSGEDDDFFISVLFAGCAAVVASEDLRIHARAEDCGKGLPAFFVCLYIIISLKRKTVVTFYLFARINNCDLRQLGRRAGPSTQRNHFCIVNDSWWNIHTDKPNCCVNTWVELQLRLQGNWNEWLMDKHRLYWRWPVFAVCCREKKKSRKVGAHKLFSKEMS